MKGESLLLIYQGPRLLIDLYLSAYHLSKSISSFSIYIYIALFMQATELIEVDTDLCK